MYMHHKKEFNGLGELVALSPAMQKLLPGAMLEEGYAINAPNEAGYYGIQGPSLVNAFTSGYAPLHHPETGQLIYQPKIKKKLLKSFDSFTVFGWVVVVLLVFSIIK